MLNVVNTSSTHWSTVEDRWPTRSALVARSIPRGSSVIDLGAGAQGLRPYVEVRGCTYAPADLVARSEDTLPFDMEVGIWPTGRWDVAVLAGVLEYATDPRDVLAHLPAIADEAIVTYAHRRSRKAIASGLFRNDLDKAAFERTAWQSGFRKVLLVDYWRAGGAGKQAVWRLR